MPYDYIQKKKPSAKVMSPLTSPETPSSDKRLDAIRRRSFGLQKGR